MDNKAKDNSPILVVEDADEDFMATKRAFRLEKIERPLIRCHSGQEALHFLLKQDNYANNTVKPILIMLDLNMPGMDGREVLSTIKSNEALKPIPVIIFTTSNDPRDIAYCYAHGVNSYIQKSVDFDDYKKSISLFYNYWFSLNSLP